MQMNDNALKQARAQKNLTLEQIEKRTKIATPYLEAMEQNDFDKLPVNLASSYIRKYAQLLNVEPTPILEAYQGHVSSVDAEPGSNGSSTLNTESRRRSRSSKPVFWKNKILWISLGSIVLLGSFSWFMISLFAGEDDLEDATEQVAVKTTQQSGDQNVSDFKVPTIDERAQLQLVEPIEVNNKEDRYQVSNAHTVELEVTAQVPTQITVHPESGEVKTISLKTDEKQTFTDAKSISIELVTPSQVMMLVNGNRVDTEKLTEKALYHFSLQTASSQ